MQNLKIAVPAQGQARIVKPPVIPLGRWTKVRHPKFLNPQLALLRSQKCRLQRKRQAARLAKGKGVVEQEDLEVQHEVLEDYPDQKFRTQSPERKKVRKKCRPRERVVDPSPI